MVPYIRLGRLNHLGPSSVWTSPISLDMIGAMYQSKWLVNFWKGLYCSISYSHKFVKWFDIHATWGMVVNSNEKWIQIKRRLYAWFNISWRWYAWHEPLHISVYPGSLGMAMLMMLLLTNTSNCWSGEKKWSLFTKNHWKTGQKRMNDYCNN